MIMFVGVFIFKEVLCMGVEVFYVLVLILKGCGLVILVGDEGGFVFNLGLNEEGFEVIIEVIEKVGYVFGKDVVFVMDVVFLEFYDKEKGVYVLVDLGEGEKIIEEMIVFYEELVFKYLIILIEDGLDENDWDGFKKLIEVLGDKV